jgi:hypothetical protein
LFFLFFLRRVPSLVVCFRNFLRLSILPSRQLYFVTSLFVLLFRCLCGFCLHLDYFDHLYVYIFCINRCHTHSQQRHLIWFVISQICTT